MLQTDDITPLIRELSGKLLRFFRKSGVAQQECYDQVQNCFETLLKKRAQGCEIEDQRRYLWGIARKKVLHYFRKIRPTEEFRSSRVQPILRTSPSLRLDRGLRVDLVLQKLSPRERTTFCLRCEGLSLEEIAQVVEKNRSTVNRDLAAIREKIDEISGELDAEFRDVDSTPESGAGMITVDDISDSYLRD